MSEHSQEKKEPGADNPSVPTEKGRSYMEGNRWRLAGNDPTEKFGEKARLVLDLAQEEARGLRHNYIGTEHLLLGLLREGESIAYKVLRDQGVELEAVRRAITFITGQGPVEVMGEIGLTPRAVATINLAVVEAGDLRQEKVAPEHLLLGILREGGGIAVGLLRTFGTTMEKVRGQIFQALAVVSSEKVTEPAPAKGNVITCRIDGRDLNAIDALIEAGVRSTRSDAAAWLIHAGIEANRALFEKVYDTVAEIRRLRVVAQSLAQEAANFSASGGEGSAEAEKE